MVSNHMLVEGISYILISFFALPSAKGPDGLLELEKALLEDIGKISFQQLEILVKDQNSVTGHILPACKVSSSNRNSPGWGGKTPASKP